MAIGDINTSSTRTACCGTPATAVSAQPKDAAVGAGSVGVNLQMGDGLLQAQILGQAVQIANELVMRLGNASGGGAAASSSSSDDDARNGIVSGGGGAMQTLGMGAAPTGISLSSAQLAGGAADNRSSAIPVSSDGNVQVKIGIGQTTYRQVVLSGGATGATYRIPAFDLNSGVGVQVFAVSDYQKSAHTTQVLVPVNGELRITPGDSVKLLVRVTGATSGTHTVDLGFGKVTANISSTVVQPLSMMTWVNASDAKARGTGTGSVEHVLQQFGVSSTGTAGAGQRGNGMGIEKFYFSAAYEAANKLSVSDVARRILQSEARLQQTNPGADLWVQVSDEQDRTAAAVSGTVAWISQLKAQLAAAGSHAKLFVATQARSYNLQYASVVDGWATTQSSVGQTRDVSIAQIKQAGQTYGHNIEVMEYPGNAFFDGGTTSSAATSVASAGLDGASSWFVFAANNLSTLEKGTGVEGRGDIGGLVAIDGGNVLPTLALAEMEYGANLAGAAQTVGGSAMQGTGAAQVRTAGRQLDAYKTGYVPNFGLWEQQIAAAL